jgi:hypothetical protein
MHKVLDSISSIGRKAKREATKAIQREKFKAINAYIKKHEIPYT